MAVATGARSGGSGRAEGRGDERLEANESITGHRPLMLSPISPSPEEEQRRRSLEILVGLSAGSLSLVAKIGGSGRC